RRKKIDKAEQPAEVEQIKQLCEKYQVPFVINDDLKLAAQFGLGVHLGQSDGEITDAKSQLPEGVIIGRTCLNSLELAQKAIADGATYVAF
ncbi:thiamine phosphate synthase, partial [Acinetobacter baumannii]